MMFSQNAKHVATFDNRPFLSSQRTNKTDVYDLKSTLDAYEVEELDGHDLARISSLVGLGDQSAGRERYR